VDLQSLVDGFMPGLLPADARLEVDALPIVHGDPGLITQVLANLAQNAVRYRQGRPLVVRVRASLEPSSWLVTVTDNGTGIAADELETVFAPGHRGSAARGTEGTGRGLATVRSLMVRIGGDAWAEAPDDPGARICLRFARPG
jgi:signal transduction histidine kinase